MLSFIGLTISRNAAGLINTGACSRQQTTTCTRKHTPMQVKQAFGSHSVSAKQRAGVSEQLQEPWGGLGLAASSEGLGEA